MYVVEYSCNNMCKFLMLYHRTYRDYETVVFFKIAQILRYAGV